MHLLPPYPLFTFLAVVILLLFISPSSSTYPVSSPTSARQSISWDIQVNSTTSVFQSVGMCKGTTDKTSKVGFIGGEIGSIWRTLDGVNWQQVAQFNYSAYWYGIYCFPDAQRIIAVGFSDGDEVLNNGAIITWSFDGGNTWTDRQSMPESGEMTWLQAVHFYNDTHGIILPFSQDDVTVSYYTTNGGKTASDWQVAYPKELLCWDQGHPTWVFGDVTKTLAEDSSTTSGPSTTMCATTNLGMSWICDAMNQNVVVGSFVTLNDGVGFAFPDNIFTTKDGGVNWKAISVLPSYIISQMVLPADMVWIPNSGVVIIVGGNDYPDFTGTVAHSLDGGITWTQSLPQLPPTVYFTSIDFVASSSSTTEVWAVGTTGEISLIIHATVTLS